jgi:leucyl-tRNA synthetase
MDTFMCSSWYFLRYTNPHENLVPFAPDKLNYWLPVDIYTGGAEHAVMHLLYARFFTKALRDMGLVDFGEPFRRLFNQGIIIAQNRKMSKSRGNVINPDDYVTQLGTDTVRAYLMFVGPWEQGGEWNDGSISGTSRWLNRVWKLVLEDYRQESEAAATDQTGGGRDPHRDLERVIHQTIRKVTEDMERLRFNTMIARLMEFTNTITRMKEEGLISKSVWKKARDTLLLLLAPTAPHLAEELWQRTGHEYSIHNQPWPEYREVLAREEEITLVVQINGKLRDRINTLPSITENEAKQMALERERVKNHLEGKQISKIIYVPGRLINLVVK